MFTGLLNKIKLHITLHHTIYYFSMISYKKKGRRHWKCSNALKFSEEDVVGVSSQNLKSHRKYFG